MDPDAAKEVAELAEAKESVFFDAPVSGGEVLVYLTENRWGLGSYLHSGQCYQATIPSTYYYILTTVRS